MPYGCKYSPFFVVMFFLKVLSFDVFCGFCANVCKFVLIVLENFSYNV
jgi:hypothetical protein